MEVIRGATLPNPREHGGQISIVASSGQFHSMGRQREHQTRKNGGKAVHGVHLPAQSRPDIKERSAAA
jgi:hypothetical protein